MEYNYCFYSATQSSLSSSTIDHNYNNKKISSSRKESKNKKMMNSCKSGVKLSTDPQSVAARERRHRISERFKILKSLVPSGAGGGHKMDTVSMLEEAIHYIKFLKTQILFHQTMFINNHKNLLINNIEPTFDHHHQEPPLVKEYPSSSKTDNDTVLMPLMQLQDDTTFCFHNDDETMLLHDHEDQDQYSYYYY